MSHPLLYATTRLGVFITLSLMSMVVAASAMAAGLPL